MKIKTVTIGRQYGSGGREVGALLAQKLGISFYDKQLLLAAAEKFGLNPGVLEERDEKRANSMLYHLSMMGIQNMEKMMTPYEVFEAECETIRRIAGNGPCVFIGRCADYALRDSRHIIRAFIYASSVKDRIERICSVDGVDPAKAVANLRKKDQQRRDYYNAFTLGEWGKMENYDVCLNSTALGYEGCADALIGLMKRDGE